jgi:hypothetical protein
VTRKKELITGYGGGSSLPFMLGLLAAARRYPKLPINESERKG